MGRRPGAPEMVEKVGRRAHVAPRGYHDPERIRSATETRSSAFTSFALVRCCLVVDLEVLFPTSAAACSPRTIPGRRSLGQKPSAPLAESAVKAGTATNGRTDRHRADGENPNQRILFGARNVLTSVQPEQTGGIAYQSSIREDTAVVARQRKVDGAAAVANATSTIFMR